MTYKWNNAWKCIWAKYELKYKKKQIKAQNRI